MTRSRFSLLFFLGFLVLFSGGCQTTKQPDLIVSEKGAVELRAIQSRIFETDDEIRTLRTVIATLQDLGYTIEKVEPAAGTVSAVKLIHLKITVTAYPRGDAHTVVRANAIISVATGRGRQRTQVDSPEFYQQLFFEPFAKAMFLTALEVDDPAAPALPDLPPEEDEQQEPGVTPEPAQTRPELNEDEGTIS